MVDANKFPKTAARQKMREEKYEAEQARQKRERAEQKKKAKAAKDQPKDQTEE